MFSCISYRVRLAPKIVIPSGSSQRVVRNVSVTPSLKEAPSCIPAASIVLPDGPWKQIPGGVTAAEGFSAAGIFGGLRAKGERPDLALVVCEVDATSAGAFSANAVAAAPVLYCKRTLGVSKTAHAVLINVGQANAFTGDAGYQDVIECVNTVAKPLRVRPEEVLILSTGVIGERIKKDALINALPRLVNSLSSSTDGGDSAAVAITSNDRVSKSVAVESQVGGIEIRVGGMAKGSGMIHPNMATTLGVITTDALVDSDVWRKMVKIAVNRSFDRITVDGDNSPNDTVIALASGLSGSSRISSINSEEAIQLQACLDAVMQGLAKSVVRYAKGAMCLIEITVIGANTEAEAGKIGRSVASSALFKGATYRREHNWERIACAVGSSRVNFHPNKLRILLGDILLMDGGQSLKFDRAAAYNYLRKACETHGTVSIDITVGNGPGSGQAWGCYLIYVTSK